MAMMILVDERDTEIGTGEKIHTHRTGALHRAFSIFVFNRAGDLLLQRRAEHKYHSGGLWSNTCCGHPAPGEDLLTTARRRLVEEMGFDCALRRCDAFVYHAPVGDGLVEYEYDHVLVGVFDGMPRPDPAEVAACRWEPLERVRDELAMDPAAFTAWFPLALDRMVRSSATARAASRGPDAA